MPPVRFNLATYRRTPAVRWLRLITMVIAVNVHAAAHVPPLTSASVVQTSVSLHAAGQTPTPQAAKNRL